MEVIKRYLPKCCFGALRVVMYLFGSLFIYAVVAFVMGGCASHAPLVVEKPVPYAVAVECNIAMPARPHYSGDVVKDVLNAIAYGEKCESVARKCGAK